MKIGIMSDSHDHLDNIKKSVDLFRKNGVDYVLHLGDYISPNAVKACAGITLTGIFGNNDGDKFRLAQAFDTISGNLKGDYHEFDEGGLKIACYHGSERQLTDALIRCGKYDVVIYGHTHKCRSEMDGQTLVINPGTVHGFGGRATIAILETDTRLTEFLDLS